VKPRGLRLRSALEYYILSSWECQGKDFPLIYSTGFKFFSEISMIGAECVNAPL
jgi:hypothetical protein